MQMALNYDFQQIGVLVFTLNTFLGNQSMTGSVSTLIWKTKDKIIYINKVMDGLLYFSYACAIKASLPNTLDLQRN